MYFLAYAMIFLLFQGVNGFTSDPGIRNKVQVVVIDPGHGGKDPGALGKHAREKDIVLNIALKLGKYIEENFEDVKIVYTRDKDIFIPLDERAEIANKAKADLFISIHANALVNSKAMGTETFVMGINKDQGNFEVAKKENSVILLEENYESKYQGFDPNSIDSYIIFSVMQKTYQGHSLAFAKMVQDEFELKAKRINRGVKQDGFWVLWRTTMPSVLIETGFLTHPEEENYLTSELGQDYLASAIFRAFRNYKNSIEESSHFENIMMSEDMNPLTEISPEKTAVIDAITTKTNSSDPNELHFKVQLLVSKNRVQNLESQFPQYNEIAEFQSGKWYKYAVGRTNKYDDIVNFCNEVRKVYPDAFIIAVKNGEVISLDKALKESIQSNE